MGRPGTETEAVKMFVKEQFFIFKSSIENTDAKKENLTNPSTKLCIIIITIQLLINY